MTDAYQIAERISPHGRGIGIQYGPQRIRLTISGGIPPGLILMHLQQMPSSNVQTSRSMLQKSWRNRVTVLYNKKLLYQFWDKQRMIDVNALQKYTLFGARFRLSTSRKSSLFSGLAHFEAGNAPRIEWSNPAIKYISYLSGEVGNRHTGPRTSRASKDWAKPSARCSCST